MARGSEQESSPARMRRSLHRGQGWSAEAASRYESSSSLEQASKRGFGREGAWAHRLDEEGKLLWELHAVLVQQELGGGRGGATGA